jgi:hypothetical protein
VDLTRRGGLQSVITVSGPAFICQYVNWNTFLSR